MSDPSASTFAAMSDIAYTAPFPQADDWFYLCIYPLLIAALGTIPAPGRHTSRTTGAIDAAIITCTTGVLIWTFLIHGFLETQRMSPAALTVALAYPVFGLFVASMVIRMAVLGGRRNPAQRLLMGGATAMLIADIAYFVGFTPTGPGPTSPASTPIRSSSTCRLPTSSSRPA